MPALPLDEAGRYVAAAYVVFVALLLVYVAIMAAKLGRIDRELGELAELAEGQPARAEAQAAAAGAGDEVPVQASEPAATPASQPADTGREAEDVGGVTPEHLGGGALR
jgi:hypothetical protein